MKSRLLLIVLLFVSVLSVKAQNPKDYIIVTIESINKKGVHKIQTDNWIFAVDDYTKMNEEDVIYPLYLSGFSATDYKECCEDKNMILFNSTVAESFEYAKENLSSRKALQDIIKDKRKKIQTIKKQWGSDKKIRVTIFLTPVNGAFCFCKISHESDNSRLDYVGQVGVPKLGFNYIPSVLESKLGRGIQTYDFSFLPFIGLDTLQ